MSTMTKPRRFGELDEWLAWFTTLHPKVIDMSLDRVLAVLATLGIARPPYKVVTVAGTNGKGSCVALLERIYLEAGFAVGAFTSPHLLRFNERIRCRGRDLDDAELVELFALIDEALGEQTLSYFEASAVAALLAFARFGADVAVLEVGMGGRLDAVNAVDADCALIVSIDLDHMDYLGPTRDLIGREKAGIARAGRPAVVADPDPPAGLLAEIERRGGELRLIGRDFGAEADDRGLLYWSGAGGERCRKRYPRPGFGGRIQVGNAAAVVAVVEALWAALPVDEAALARGLATASVRGRFERHRIGATEWIFDVAHNPAAAALFDEALRELPPVARTLAVFGAMRDKDLRAVLARFTDRVDAWFVAAIDSDRGADPDEIRPLLEALGAREVHTFADIEAAARAARAAPADRVLAFGSFYTVGPAMTELAIY
jgi:dihydrofolate synthase/folylpolyglutamate synthase